MKGGKTKIIIVDDHQMVRETWRMILENVDGFIVIEEFGSGVEAISRARELDPHVILMDINMSPVNGFEATRKILEEAPHIKIIGLSVNNQPGYARNMLQLGAKGYVTKNSSQTEMVKAIQQVMEGKTYICAEVKAKMQN